MISKTIVKHPVTILIAFILLIALGIYAGSGLSVDLYPEIKYPGLLVSTDYTGAGPEEVEKSLTRPLESVISMVGNIEKITSTSSEGSSMIMITFSYGTNMDTAANDIRDKLEYIKDIMPEGAKSPMIFKFDISMMPIMNMIVTGNRSPEELRKISTDIIQPRLQQIDGVASAGINGGRERLIRIEIPQNRLEAYNLTLTQVSNMLQGQNMQISAGSITEGNKNYLVTTRGEYNNLEEIKDTVISYKSDATNPMNPAETGSTAVIRLRDIANVYDGLKKEESSVFVNGQPGVYIFIQKQTGKNSVKVAEAINKLITPPDFNIVQKIIKFFNPNIEMKQKPAPISSILPGGINIRVVTDNTVLIKNSLNSVVKQIIEGLIFSILILFLFLRSLRGVIIMGVAAPISVIITMMLMYFFHQTLNIMTLAGLALGVGKLVDDSIIIFEKIYTYREKGAKHSVAAIIGTQEMLTAVTASTFTTICVYAPIIMFKDQLGMIGELFVGLAFTVVISLAASLLVALFLVPVLSSTYLPIRTRLEEPLTGLPKLIDDALDKFWVGLANKYKSAIRFVLHHKIITVFTILIIFISSFIFVPIIGLEFLPQTGGDTVNLNVELPIGTKLEETKNMMSQIENVVKNEIKGYKDIVVSSGEKGFYGFLGAPQSHKGSLTITLPEYSKRIDDAVTVKEKLRKHFNDFPSVLFSFPSSGMSGSSSSPIDILVKSNDLTKARLTAEKIRLLLKDKVPEATEPLLDLKDGLPQIEIKIDRDKAYSLGLSIYTIGQELKANIDGITSTKFKEGGNEFDVLVILDPNDRQALPDLERIFVVNQSGDKIPVSSFAYLEKTTGPVSINRENQTRTIHLTAGLAPGARIDQVDPKVKTLIKQEILQDDDVVIEYGGDFAELFKMLLKFVAILLISLALVFGIMAAQFESFIDPFIIIFTVPLTLIGIFAMHFLTGEKLSMYTAVGLVVLVGVVVNNGIILVDYTNLLRRRGYSIFEACVEAGGNRLRPVIMTTLTLVLGLIPMAFFAGEGTDLSQPLAKTILGGLIVSSIFTLFLIPTIYSIFNQMSDNRKAKKEIKQQQRMEYRRKKLAGEIV